MKCKTKIVSCFQYLALSILLLAAAHAQALESLLVTKLVGEASFQSEDGKTHKLESFLKLNRGEEAVLKSAAKMQVVYLKSGEVERWEGPAKFVVGAEKTQNIKEGKPTRTKLPAPMVERIARTPDVMSDIRNRNAMVTMREPEPEAVGQARKEYKKLRKRAAADDITPELYFFVVAHENNRPKDVALMLDEMEQRAGKDPTIAEFISTNRSKLPGKSAAPGG